MFETLFSNPIDSNRHKNASWVKERERYLEHLVKVGYARITVVQTASRLLHVVRELKLSPSCRITIAQIRQAAHCSLRGRLTPTSSEHQVAYKNFIQVATQWLRFLGYLYIPLKNQTRFENYLKDFLSCEEQERGISPRTLEIQAHHIRSFLCWYQRKRCSLSLIQPTDIDAFLAHQGRKGWSRTSIAAVARALRSFFRHGGRHGWCPTSLADSVEGPRIFSQETLPAGPSWEQVQAIISRVNTDHPSDIRDRAILMFPAIYGLRASEVSQLRLQDIDWQHERITVRRVKNQKTHVYPLLPVVGDALIRYLKEVRPRCACPEVFLRLRAPLRPLARSGIHRLTKKQFSALGIKTLHQGPHALRHACAAHLLSEGFSLKEIGDHLGHRSASATRIYAKVDIPHLRQVADFDLGGLL